MQKDEATGKAGSGKNPVPARAVKMLEIMAGGIAHDYNNILTVILGNLTLARSYPELHSEVLEVFSDIENAVQKAKEITDSLIAFSRKENLVFKRGIVCEMLKKAVDAVFPDGDVLLDFIVDDQLWDIEFDRLKLEAAFTYIFQFFRSGALNKRRLKIEITNSLQESARWQKISITDLNLVLLDEKLANLFSPLFSIKKLNFGIGLVSAYSLILKHNGHMLVTSEAGKGTTFTILLPAFPD